MEKLRSIVSFLLLSVYSLVLLHNIVPHIHMDGGNKIISEIAHADHHHHDHHDHHDHDDSKNSHHNHSNSEGEILHSLGHLFDGFHHAENGEDCFFLTPVENKISQTKLKVVFAALPSFVLLSVDIYEGEQILHYSEPYTEQLLSSALPLRAPPALS